MRIAYFLKPAAQGLERSITAFLEFFFVHDDTRVPRSGRASKAGRMWMAVRFEITSFSGWFSRKSSPTGMRRKKQAQLWRAFYHAEARHHKKNKDSFSPTRSTS